MATIKQLKEEVFEQVRSEGTQAIQTAKEELGQALTSKQESLKEAYAKQKQVAKERSEAELERKKQSYTNQLNQELLRAKQDLFQEVFQEAIQSMTQFSSEEFEELVDQSLQAIEAGEGTGVGIGEESQSQWGAESKARLQSKYPQVEFQSTFLKNHGGFVLQEATMDYDLTYDQILLEKEAQLTSQFNQQLSE